MNDLTTLAVIVGVALHIVILLNVLQTIRLYFKFRPEFKRRNPKRVFTNVFIGSADINELAYEDRLKQGFTKIPLFTRADHIDISSNILGVYLFIAVIIPLVALVPAVISDKRTPEVGLAIWAGFSLIAVWAQIALTLTVIFRRWLARRTGALWPSYELVTYTLSTSPVDDKISESLKLKAPKDTYLTYMFYLAQVLIALLITSPVAGIAWILITRD